MSVFFCCGVLAFAVSAGESVSQRMTDLQLVRPTEENCRVFKEDWRHVRWLAHEKEIKASGGAYDLVLIGDSITHGWEIHTNGYLVADRPALKELKKRYKVLNLGYSGDRTSDVLWRLSNGELDGYTAKFIQLMIGTNNCGHPAEETAEGIRRILGIVREKHPESVVLLTAIFPRQTRTSEARRRNDEVNAIIRGFADGQKVVWVDFRSRLMDAEGDTKALFPDGTHPNERGYEIWLEELLKIKSGAASKSSEEASGTDSVVSRPRAKLRHEG